MKAQEKIGNQIASLRARIIDLNESIDVCNNQIALYTNVLNWIKEDEKEEIAKNNRQAKPLPKEPNPDNITWKDLLGLTRLSMCNLIYAQELIINSNDHYEDENLRIEIAKHLNIVPK